MVVDEMIESFAHEDADKWQLLLLLLLLKHGIFIRATWSSFPTLSSTATNKETVRCVTPSPTSLATELHVIGPTSPPQSLFAHS